MSSKTLNPKQGHSFPLPSPKSWFVNVCVPLRGGYHKALTIWEPYFEKCLDANVCKMLSTSETRCCLLLRLQLEAESSQKTSFGISLVEALPGGTQADGQTTSFRMSSASQMLFHEFLQVITRPTWQFT